MKVMMLSNQGRSMSIFWRALIEAMQQRGMQVSACLPAGETLDGLHLPLCHYSLDRKGINPLRDLQTLRQLERVFMAQKPDILFATTIKPVIYGCIAARRAGIPRIFATITGLGYAFEADAPLKILINRISRILYRKSLAGASGVFFQNRDDLRVFREQSILSAATPVFLARGTGVDTAKFAPAPLPAGAPVFLLVARLLEAKGILDYAVAARLLKKQYPLARFQLLGPREQGRGAITAAQLAQIEKDVEYLGETRDVRPFLAAAHVAVLPSWREGLPTALMEAMSMGRALVASDAPGCREVLRPGVNGFFCLPGDPQSLARAMRNFLERPALCASMGAASRALAEREFDAKTVAADILADMARSKK